MIRNLPPPPVRRDVNNCHNLKSRLTLGSRHAPLPPEVDLHSEHSGLKVAVQRHHRHLPHAGTAETELFARADMLHTKVDEGKKDDASDVAATGFKAMMSGCNYKRRLPISPPLLYLPSSTARRLTS